MNSIRSNSMLFFYEPLSRSLEKTGKFDSVEAIGRHTDVTVFRCETRRPTLGQLVPPVAAPASLKDDCGPAARRRERGKTVWPASALRRPSRPERMRST